MPIEGQQRSLDLPQFVRLAPADVVPDLGPLGPLVGTWTGKLGWNLIAVPTPGSHPEGFTLLVRPYYETITFSPLGVVVPDRGASEILNINGLEYSLKVSDLLTNEPLHLENGMWLYMEDPENPDAPSVVRQAVVPHGNSVLALGSSQQSGGAPTIPELFAYPVGNPFSPPLDGYTDVYQFAAPQVPGQPPFSASDANSVLRDAIKDQNIVSTLTLSVSTEPRGNGGIVNIPFIQKNANATTFSATFWIETVENPVTGETFDQLQYSQCTNLEFITCASQCAPEKEPGEEKKRDPLIVWPHVNVNTLVRQ
jgi:hypothetical protein